MLLLQFAENHDIKFFYEVSAKTGANVNESFVSFFKDIHQMVSTGVYSCDLACDPLVYIAVT